MNTFCAIEKVLAFHHTTTSRPILLANLVEKANTTTSDTLEVLASWPAGYKITKLHTHQFVEASETPMDLNGRKERYASEHILPVAGQKADVKVSRSSSAPGQPPKVMKRSTERKTRMTMEQILERALKKQAEKGLVEEKSRKIKHEFLGAQVPVVEGVLRSLGSLSRSFSLNEIIRKVQYSSKCPLGAQEVVEILERIDFVKVIDAGGIKFIELIAPTLPGNEIAIKA